MACDHRYRVEYHEGKGSIECRLCGDIREQGIPLDADQEAIRDRIEWEQKKANREGRELIWLPPGA